MILMIPLSCGNAFFKSFYENRALSKICIFNDIYCCTKAA